MLYRPKKPKLGYMYKFIYRYMYIDPFRLLDLDVWNLMGKESYNLERRYDLVIIL